MKHYPDTQPCSVGDIVVVNGLIPFTGIVVSTTQLDSGLLVVPLSPPNAFEASIDLCRLLRAASDETDDEDDVAPVEPPPPDDPPAEDPPPPLDLPGLVLELLSIAPGYLDVEATLHHPDAQYVSIRARRAPYQGGEGETVIPEPEGTNITQSPTGNGTWSINHGWPSGQVVYLSAAQAITQNNMLTYGPELEVTIP